MDIGKPSNFQAKIAHNKQGKNTAALSGKIKYHQQNDNLQERLNEVVRELRTIRLLFS